MAEKVPWTPAYSDWPLKSEIKNQESRIEKWLCSFPLKPLKRRRLGSASQKKSRPETWLRWSEILARAKPNSSKDSEGFGFHGGGDEPDVYPGARISGQSTDDLSFRFLSN